jgi:prepilin-type processing-associated H-X9-DG protein
VEVNEPANFVLSHAGEMVSGAGRPIEINHYSSNHAGGGATFVFADGHVRFLTGGTDYATLKALATRAGGESITGDY